MLKQYHKYLLKKGLKLLISNPKTLVYKIKQLHNSTKQSCMLNHTQIRLVHPYAPTELNFIPDVIIPIYNGYDFLFKLVTQLISHTHLKYHLILINDCSTDKRVDDFLKSIKSIKTNHDIIILNNSTNLGFVKTVNRGMQLTRNHFIILNTDVEVPRYFANKILQPILDDDKVASVTPFTNSGTICSFPVFCRDNNIFGDLDVQSIDDVFGVVDYSLHNIIIPTGVGFCMAINKNAYIETGMFNEEVFTKGYGEENDWCMRAAAIGFKHIHAVNCFVYHKHGGSFSLEQKQALLQDNYKKLLAMHPNYEQIVHRFCAVDPAQEIREFMIFKILTDLLPTVCILNTVYSGGAKAYLNNLSSLYIREDKVVLLVEAKDLLGKVKLVLYYKEYKFKFTCADVFILLAKLSIDEIVINHLVFNHDLAKIILLTKQVLIETKSNLTVVIHDYFFLCPSLNLLGYNNKYCNLPKDSVCNKCLNNFSAQSIGNEYVTIYKPEFNDINIWRNIFKELFNYTNEIVVPSELVKSLFLKIYPDIKNKITILEHDLSYLSQINSKLDYIPFAKHKVTIAIVGGIGKHKGSQELLKMIKLSNNKKLQIQWVVIGELYPKPKFPLNNLHIHNQYTLKNLANLVNKFQPDMFVLPSIWPETFCYTASEMMHFNLPLVSFNIGAHAQRIHEYWNGYLVDDITSESMLDTIINIIQKQQ